jgi:hypothetical protein
VLLLLLLLLLFLLLLLLLLLLLPFLLLLLLLSPEVDVEVADEWEEEKARPAEAALGLAQLHTCPVCLGRGLCQVRPAHHLPFLDSWDKLDGRRDNKDDITACRR